ncbi:MAG: hypothetical protein JNM31_12560 [Flavobacteriales bacterium]|nr:hypothetical protein [Flavobacteriales bacterium]
MIKDWSQLQPKEREAAFRKVLDSCFAEAEKIVNEDEVSNLEARLGPLYHSIQELGALTHAAPGVALTLATYKVCNPEQDVAAHKDDHVGGFSARGYDTSVTVPFLIEKMLPRNVETHWLTQTFSFAPEFRKGLELKTTPKKAGPLLVTAVAALQDHPIDFARAVVTTILVEKIRIRNQDKVTVTRPKNLSIEATVSLIERHLAIKYRQNAPRLPQLVIYAVYQCIVQHVSRYQGCELQPLARLKSADRKSNTVGDIVVTQGGTPFEAVEIKYGQPITFAHVSEAIEKVRALTVRRYYMLSTEDVEESEIDRIKERKDDFLKQNGCELILNGILASLSYYLRLLPDTTDFVMNYATLVETDQDTSYEHRISWNSCCQAI